MMDEKDAGKRTVQGSYEDMLGELTHHASRGDEVTAFIDSMDLPPPPEGIPIQVGKKVREVREERGLSLLDISQRTGFDVGLLDQIEEGTVSPPLGTVIRLAKALDMRMGYLISGEEDLPFTIVRLKDRKTISRYDSRKGKHYGYTYESLAPHKKDRHMEPFLVTLEPSETEEERSSHPGQEFIFVLEGHMEVRLGEEIHVIDPGDAIYYDSTVPHLVKCHGGVRTRILAVLYAEP